MLAAPPVPAMVTRTDGWIVMVFAARCMAVPLLKLTFEVKFSVPLLPGA